MNKVNKICAITAIVTAHTRIEQTLITLTRIKNCIPTPAEILVHVDDGQWICAEAVRKNFPDIPVFVSHESLGPGGSRNQLIAKATHNIVASFDDDSYPIDQDYFSQLIALFNHFPDASIICARVYHRGENIKPATQDAQWVADFSGGASAYNRNSFLTSSGYVPLSIAYGMEEVDYAIRLHAHKGKVLQTNWLRIFHDTTLDHHSNSHITATSIANIALLTFLRYPFSLWIIGCLQLCSRILWLLKHKRSKGIISGVLMIPTYLWQYKSFREPVSSRALLSYLALRKKPCHITEKLYLSI